MKNIVLLIIMVALLLAGCTHAVYETKDGTKVSWTNLFTDKTLEDVHVTSSQAEGVKFDLGRSKGNVSQQMDNFFNMMTNAYNSWLVTHGGSMPVATPAPVPIE